MTTTVADTAPSESISWDLTIYVLFHELAGLLSATVEEMSATVGKLNMLLETQD